MIPLVLLVVVIAFVAYDLKRTGPVVDAPAAAGAGAPGVVRALGRFEARKLVRSPSIAIGVVFIALWTLLVGTGGVPVMSRDEHATTLGLFPFAGMVLIAVTSAVLRGRRSGAEELLASMPSSADVRAGGHLLSVSAAVAIAAAGLGAQLAYVYALGGIGAPNVGDLLTGIVLVACAGAVGVTAARLVPAAAIGIVAVVAMGVFQGTVDHFSGPGTSRPSWFAPYVAPPEFFPADVWVRRPWSHLVYLIGLGTFAAVLGFLRHRRDARAAAALGVAFALIAAGGIVQSRPVTDAEYDRMAAAIERPALVCERAGEAEMCAHAELREMIAHWRPAVAGSLAALPARASAAPPRIVQRFRATDLYALPEPLRRRLSSSTPSEHGDAWQSDGAVHPDVGWCGWGACEMALAGQVAAWGVGLPLDATATHPNPDDPYASPILDGYDATGEARAVVALWIAARATPGARRAFFAHLSRPARGGSEAMVVDGESRLQLSGCDGLADTGVRFGATEALYAEQLLTRADEGVLRALHLHWGAFTRPETPSSDLARRLGLSDPTPARVASLRATLC